MAEVKESGILIQDAETKNIMTKSTLPVGGYSVNPYVGCTHGCKYCYASFMKRFTGHTEPWGTFLDAVSYTHLHPESECCSPLLPPCLLFLQYPVKSRGKFLYHLCLSHDRKQIFLHEYKEAVFNTNSHR